MTSESRHADWYFDVLSPFAYLQLKAHLPRLSLQHLQNGNPPFVQNRGPPLDVLWPQSTERLVVRRVSQKL